MNITYYQLKQLSLYFIVSILSISALQAEKEKPLPNVLILYADDMGYGDLGVQNPESKIPTPHLDQLAKEGMRFTDGHSSSGICTPSRYALLTGRYHWREFHGIVKAFGESVFTPELVTLPEMLQSQGYATACIGKWHLGWDWNSIRKSNATNKGLHFANYDWSKPIADGPLAHGFDYYFGDNVINFPPYVWIENDKVVDVPDTQMSTKNWKPLKEGGWECRPGPMITGWDPYEVLPEITRKAVSYIEGRKEQDQPFFLYFSFPSPHAPIVPAEEFEGKSDAGPYGDFVYQTDWSCGQILQALEDNGLADNTIVIFTADNGAEHFAYPRAKKYGHWSSKPFRGLKRDIYEGGHHVPFLVKWPAQVEANSVSDALVSQIDIMGTIAAAVGIEVPEKAAFDSYNFLPVLTGEKVKARESMVHNTFEEAYAMRQGDWVLINATTGNHNGGRAKQFEVDNGYTKQANTPVQLYNLAKDPAQKVNLAEIHPEKVEELQSLLAQIRFQL